MTPDEAIAKLKIIRDNNIKEALLWHELNEILETIEKQKEEARNILYQALYGIGGYYG